MKPKIYVIVMIMLGMLLVFGCDERNPKPKDMDIATAFGNYWQYQDKLTEAMEARDGTMAQIQAKIKALGSNRNKDAFSEIDALVATYVAQSNAIAEKFDTLIKAENAIVEYGDNKGLLTSVAKGIYTKAKDTVVSSGKMVRSGWRVMSGRQSLGQVLRDPDSGIPIVSSFALTVQKRNTARDTYIRQAILNWNPATSPVDTNHLVPYDQLPGSTPQEKANAYANLSDEDPIKMQTRGGVITWVEQERLATAEAAVELGETGVKVVGDAYGGGVGEWTNEILNQHMEEHQNQNQSGNLNIKLNQDGTPNLPIAETKTLIISKANKPDGDPRITVIMGSPQTMDQPLPTGEYNIIAMANGFIRNVYENVKIVQGQATNIIAELMKLSENAIIIEDLKVDEGSITVGSPVNAHVSCVSTIGKSLSFEWSVTGGNYTNLNALGTNLKFTPTEEKEYTISVTVSDDANHSKTRSIAVSSMGARLAIDNWEISQEGFVDGKLNPGENLTVKLFVSNTSAVDISGTQSVSAPSGVTVQMTPNPITIAAGQTAQVNVPLRVAVNYSEPLVTLQYNLMTQNQSNIPVLLTDMQAIPLDFYVDINEVTQLVTERLLTITGKVANPSLSQAMLILDNDIEHAFNINLSNGSFSQAVVLPGSNTETQHKVQVIAVSGSLTADDTIYFNSQISVMALKVTLTWDTNNTDVDLWVTDPNGEKCYFGHRNTASGLALDVDDTNGYGPENTTSPAVIPGDYRVQVHYWSDHDYENAIGTNCVVVITLNEGASSPPVNYYGFLADSGDLWNVTTLHFDAVKGWSLNPQNSYGKVNPASLGHK